MTSIWGSRVRIRYIVMRRMMTGHEKVAQSLCENMIESVSGYTDV